MNPSATNLDWDEEPSAGDDALGRNEPMFRQLFDRSADAIWLLDPQARVFVDCNQEGARDDQMAMALAIRTSMEAGMARSVLQGLLSAREISLEGIALHLGLELDVVKQFEGLFFNVRNRESTFALNTIFPLTRLGAVREVELDYNEVDLMPMRVGRDYGWKAVAKLVGLLTIEDADDSPETMLADVEKTMAANARRAARSSWYST